jgi:hypothetical protein
MWFFFRIIAPVVWFVVVASLQSMFVAVIAMWRSVPGTLDTIATHWQAEALLRGWPSRYDVQIYWFFYMLAGAMFVFGWILCSWLTLIILHLIF